MTKIFFILLLFTACKAQYATSYKISTATNSYYTNEYQIKNDSIYFSELKRNKGKIRGTFAIPYSSAVIKETNY